MSDQTNEKPVECPPSFEAVSKDNSTTVPLTCGQPTHETPDPGEEAREHYARLRERDPDDNVPTDTPDPLTPETPDPLAGRNIVRRWNRENGGLSVAVEYDDEVGYLIWSKPTDANWEVRAAVVGSLLTRAFLILLDESDARAAETAELLSQNQYIGDSIVGMLAGRQEAEIARLMGKVSVLEEQRAASDDHLARVILKNADAISEKDRYIAELEKVLACPWCGGEIERIPADGGDEIGCGNPNCLSAGIGVWCYADSLRKRIAELEAQLSEAQAASDRRAKRAFLQGCEWADEGWDDYADVIEAERLFASGKLGKEA